jgi:hypothetical protein
MRVLPSRQHWRQHTLRASTTAVTIAVSQDPSPDDPWAGWAAHEVLSDASRRIGDSCVTGVASPMTQPMPGASSSSHESPVRCAVPRVPARVLGGWSSASQTPVASSHRLHWDPCRGIWTDARDEPIVPESRGLRELQEEAPSPRRLQCHAVGKTRSGNYFVEDTVTHCRRVASTSLQEWVERAGAPLPPPAVRLPSAAVPAPVLPLPPRPERPPPRQNDALRGAAPSPATINL